MLQLAVDVVLLMLFVHVCACMDAFRTTTTTLLQRGDREVGCEMRNVGPASPLVSQLLSCQE